MGGGKNKGGREREGGGNRLHGTSELSQAILFFSGLVRHFHRIRSFDTLPLVQTLS